MATYCPNPSCQRKLRLTDWRQSCPDCGVNTVFYHQTERLEEEADTVELSAAMTQKKYDRMKAAVKGNKAAVARFTLLFSPLILAALPAGIVILADLIRGLPVMNNTVGFLLSSGLMEDTDRLLNGNLRVAALLLGLVLAVLAMLAGWVTSIMACGPKWFPRNMIISGAGFGASLLALGSYLKIAEIAAAKDLGTLLGIVGLLLAYGALLIINIRIQQAGGVPVAYKACTIAGRPEEEVMAFLASGGTVKELRLRDAGQAAEG